MSTANLRFLTSEQALHDIARFNRYIAGVTPGRADDGSAPAITLKYSAAESVWVGFGGSYPGALAAWVKTKFPSLFVGTVASSAPVQPMYDFYQYAQVVGAALSRPDLGGGADCVSAIAAGASALAATITLGSPVPANLPEALKPCGPIQSEPDLAVYFSEIFGNLQGVVQYNLEQNNTHVSDVCATALKISADEPLKQLAAVTGLFANQSAPFKKRCIQSNWTSDMIAPLTNITFDGQQMMRQWIWQSCNEFG